MKTETKKRWRLTTILPVVALVLGAGTPITLHAYDQAQCDACLQLCQQNINAFISTCDAYQGTGWYDQCIAEENAYAAQCYNNCSANYCN